MIRRRLSGLLLICVVFALATSAPAQVFEARRFENPENARRYQALTSELRCLVCQNQNLADSNAPLAADLRQLIYDMILEDKSDAEIIDFMVARYGDFILYRPPLKPTTLILWIGPFLLLALGFLLLLRQLRRRASQNVAAVELSAGERERLGRVLGSDDSQSNSRPGD